MNPPIEGDRTASASDAATPAARGRGSANWIRKRARNVYRRSLLLASIAGLAFVVSLLFALLIRPRAEHGPSKARSSTRLLRTDTLAVRHQLGVAESAVATTDLALERARGEVAGHDSAAVRRMPSPAEQVLRDSLVSASANLARLLRRTAAAPLPASYRALGAAPEMQGLPRVPELLDTLTEVEKSRATFGATGGVDPIFLALTAREAQIGRAIEVIGRARYSALLLQADSVLSRSAAPKIVDTVLLAARADSARRTMVVLNRELARERLADSMLNARAPDPTVRTNDRTPIGAILTAALVLALASAFGLVFVLELRQPMISDAAEAEVVAGSPVLVSIRDQSISPERLRRQADLDVPPLIDQNSDEYRLLYTQLADRSFNLPLLGVTGDDALVTAVVAANLAAATARQVRTTLLVDTEAFGRSVASVARVQPTPGMADVLAGAVGWTEAIASVVVGRGRTLDVLPGGGDSRSVQGAAYDRFVSTISHLARRYECVIVSTPYIPSASASVTDGTVMRAVGEVIVCVRIGRTPVSLLDRIAREVRTQGASIRGIVLWDRAAPIPEVPGSEWPVSKRKPPGSQRPVLAK